eukprot:11005910-Alexandrium_andersonii.AAC.1
MSAIRTGLLRAASLQPANFWRRTNFDCAISPAMCFWGAIPSHESSQHACQFISPPRSWVSGRVGARPSQASQCNTDACSAPGRAAVPDLPQGKGGSSPEELFGAQHGLHRALYHWKTLSHDDFGAVRSSTHKSGSTSCCA